ncbi:serine/threonine-protein kinase [Streptomyces sp. NBC_00825]|uniref:serine/threonine-protein kinase n=1 Tax=unclassified Streptomyces TaxID=2593676 RepID=UPI0022574045|nr:MULTISPECIES: serine/threonine-protein kinase [unclassified Streptomyces]WTB55033.1 serine/threonine-protein kinase [Streptomyces sp. NBC_00826]WTH92082.1 serine/threonine-protein kinase [Streptomyces sp. NBC_00825]WTI00811.1 serine/threonine-protein kinase [Streptomyces sp. NBC_00822]MCX4866343.1 serine/threonine-protein kinase [Streptomyces sp. NBC_00906]MCX4897581.1 serine/threonine-protein kinase [Streptomyces sp. NBC_00892]
MPPLRGTGANPEAEHPEYAGQYRLGARLGAGGMGVVHLARSASGLQLAVKVVHRQYAANPEFRARFRQEVGAARRVSGAFTASVVDADPDAARPWMATLYVPGPTLADQVKRNGPLAPAELRRLTAGLAEALRDIHRAGVIHRDLKPSNVLLSDSGPKVIDFGISRPYDSDLRTETGKLIGSPPYMAPEQFQRPREVGPAADVFALGAVLVHAATGRGPFDSDSPYIVAYQVVHDEADLAGVPADLAPLIGKCLTKDPAGRPTPDEIMTTLRPPSYEAAAFIPSQRRPAVTGAGTGTKGAVALVPEAGARAGAEADTHVGDGKAGATGGANKRRWLAATAALLVMGAGGVWAVGAGAGSGGSGGSGGQGGPKGSAEEFAPWRTALRTTGRSTPVCSPAGGSGAETGGSGAAASGPPAALYCATGGIGVSRLDPADGRVLWSRRAEADAPAVGVVSVSGGLVHTAVPGGKLRAYDPAKGEQVWDADLSPYLGTPFGADDTLLLVAEDGTTEALDSATGVSLWRHALAGHQRPDYALYDAGTGLAYAFEHSAYGSSTLVTAVDATTGRTAWQRRLDGMLTPVGTSDGALVLTSMNGDAQTVGLVRYDPARGRAVRTALPFRMNEPEVVMGGDTAYLLAHGGTLVAVDTRPAGGEAVRWQLETAAGRTSAPVLAAGNRLYFSAADGRLLAVDTVHGKLLGQTAPRLRNGRLTYSSALPAPVAAGRTVFGTAPDGSVFAVDGQDPASW